MHKLPIDLDLLTRRGRTSNPIPSAPLFMRKLRIVATGVVVAAIVLGAWAWAMNRDYEALPTSTPVDQPRAVRTDCDTKGAGKVYRQVLYDDTGRPIMTWCFRVRAAAFTMPRLEVR